MQQLFDLAFARLDRAKEKRVEFGRMWETYISDHPWEIDLTVISETEFEFFAVQRAPAPAALSLVFSEWLATIRAALDNGFYAWVAAVTRQNPPAQAERLQYPICATSSDFKRQRSRLTSVPQEIVDMVEKAQPYQSPLGPESNLFYWVNELARTDRHRTPHIGIGRIATHKVRIKVPEGVTARFDPSVQPFQAIDDRIVLCRFTTSTPLRRSDLYGSDFRGVGIDPEIRAWAGFNMGGRRQSLRDRMVYAEIFTRRDLESMAAHSGCKPPEGFQLIDPASPPLE
ncbi:hypothetical protein F6J84_06060 [Microbacterium caowuchunii]|uniref:hypothetical protein n=1 Tax=Microbacterium caowuchunii TaxID=2614638 RepID=UPI0012478FE5|nr:hypothetical protein [Microbacterium caowuchunii]QEV99704.1 hypothetical protein F6J84_06060 [Microbacterium caowuchunii]